MTQNNMQFYKEQLEGWYYKIPIVALGIIVLGIIGNYLN